MSWWRNYLFIPARKPVFTRKLVVSFGFKCKYHWRWYTRGSILSIQESTIVHRKLNAKPVSNTTDHASCQQIGQLNIWGKFNNQIRWNPNIWILIHNVYTLKYWIFYIWTISQFLISYFCYGLCILQIIIFSYPYNVMEFMPCHYEIL